MRLVCGTEQALTSERAVTVELSVVPFTTAIFLSEIPGREEGIMTGQ
jgi:hypothetical protein